MERETGFYLGVTFSILVVSIFGAWSISKQVERFGVAQLSGGLPVGEVRDAFEEFKTRTASSLEQFSRYSRESANENEMASVTSSAEFIDPLTQ